jgi:hypothetical protein
MKTVKLKIGWLLKSLVFSMSFILAIIFLSSCSGKLDRGNAEKLIKEYYDYPIIETNLWNWEGTPDQQKYLMNLGLIQKNSYSSNAYELTKQGEKYITSKGIAQGTYVLTSKLTFNEITGITFLMENTAEVKYTVKRNSITPFGKFAGFKEGDIVTHTIKIKKFDDGWRIDKEKPKNRIDDYKDLFASQKD